VQKRGHERHADTFADSSLISEEIGGQCGLAVSRGEGMHGAKRERESDGADAAGT
jgi:hypothetical protein